MQEEINLMDYVKVLFKRKRGLISFLFLGILVGAGLTFLAPRRYIAITSLEIGTASGGLFEGPEEIITKIDIGYYSPNSLLEDYEGYLKVDAWNPAKTSLLQMRAVGDDLQIAKKALTGINETIIAKHNQELNERKTLLEENLKQLEEDTPSLIFRGQQTASLHLEKYRLKRQLQELIPTKIIQKPSQVIIESSLLLSLASNAIFGGIAGAALGIFWVYLKEWWDKNKYLLRQQTTDSKQQTINPENGLASGARTSYKPY